MPRMRFQINCRLFICIIVNNVPSPYCFRLQEAVIDDYFKPLDKQVQKVMKTQLEGEEKSMKQMMTAMQEQAFHEQALALKNAKVHDANAQTSNRESESEPPAPREANAR